MLGVAVSFLCLSFFAFWTILQLILASCAPKFHDVLSEKPPWNSQTKPCYVTGDAQVPHDLQILLNRLAGEGAITCDFSRRTIGNVPDVSTATRSFSNIIYPAEETATPLEFALKKFTTEGRVTLSTLQIVEQRRDLYLATEIGVMSEGGKLDNITTIRKFLDLQVARIRDALDVDVDPQQPAEVLLADLMDDLRGKDRDLLVEAMCMQSMEADNFGI
ncbi:hypothetical protein BU24DRAFT_463548 [Aaosphaeria arxii CBS 175.79]|uniref:DUF7143 domain-containing protein n=1 Tax=Aaosphaeria arxii CBS 175.79 TaxID=1450172 RepID=A0A6A5XPV9_9PLEO|nr:uncharacterized protein BU24DRAFT_463548 [Aaosphaeria arxii CBS 175.79]KAF2014791.1 hypothetical protein BU24DRAFT_463548 [Aaosphaeria arxii CBS 175.79]